MRATPRALAWAGWAWVAVVLAGLGISACYESHEAGDFDSSVPDAPAADAPASDAHADASDASVDAGSGACSVRCEPARVIARRDDAVAPHVEGVYALRRAGDRLAAVVLRRVPGRYPSGAPSAYTLATFDLDTGHAAVRSSDADPRTQDFEAPAALRSQDGAFGALVLHTDAHSRDPATVRLSRIRWPPSSAAEVEEWAVLPHAMQPCDCTRMGAAFGAGSVAAAAVADADRVQAAIAGAEGMVHLHPMLVALGEERTGAVPLAGAAHPGTGGLALAGGGTAGRVPARPAFVAFGQPMDGRWEAHPLPGQVYDPPPVVAAGPDGFSVYRYATRADDIDDSTIVRVRYDVSGAERAEQAIALAGGLAPAAMAAAGGEAGPWLAWVQPPVDPSGSMTLHVAPSRLEGSGRRCDTVRAEAVARLPVPPLRSEIGPPDTMAAWADDAGLFVLILDNDRTLTALHVPDCEVEG